MPVLMVALAFVPFWLARLNEGSVKNITIINHTGIYAPLLKSTDLYQFQIIKSAEKEAAELRIGKDLAVRIREHALAIGTCHVEATSIDAVGIGVAVRMAMAGAIEDAGVKPDCVLIDGRPLRV